MSGTVKTVLIVGAAAAAAFVLLRALAPAPVMVRPATGGGISVRGLLSLGSAIGNGLSEVFGSSPPSTPTEIDGTPTSDFTSGHFGVDYS